MKIKKLEISGLRGVKQELTLELSGKSALIYGDNGAGKSTISDAIEWYYRDKVEHLKGEEIGRSGIEALRHIDLSNEYDATTSIHLSDDSLTSKKSLSVSKSKLVASHSNGSDKFKSYLDESSDENLILQYRELTTFILATKKDRLATLSAIIGYKDITGTFALLKSAYNAAQKTIRLRDFPRLFADLDQEIIEQYGQNITTDDQFLEVTNGVLKSSNCTSVLKTLPEINSVLKEIGKPDNHLVKKEDFLNRVTTQLSSVEGSLKEIDDQYKQFYDKFSEIIKDTEKLKKLLLESVLSSTSQLLANKAYTTNECPVCLSGTDIDELKSNIDKRILELAEIKAEQTLLFETRDAIAEEVLALEGKLLPLLSDEQASEEWFSELGKQINSLLVSTKKYDSAIKQSPKVGVKISEREDLQVSVKTTSLVHNFAKTQLDETREALNADSGMQLYNKINIAGRAYYRIRNLKKEKSKLEAQRDTIEIFVQEFAETQRDALQSFLNAFSDRIEETYQFMNPDVKVGNIKLVPLEKDSEMVGMTFQMDFLDHKNVSPPHKYLSESHLNCIGIAFFLASAEAFNKKNKFLVMDDVISSFDENHRKRFGDLLVEKFSHFQIIVLTHERSWFELLRNQVRGKPWVVETVKHTDEGGTVLNPPPSQLREAIEAKIKDKDVNGLASSARIYLEGLLKNIASHLEVQVAFRFNVINEDRMANELLSGLRSQINKRKCVELKGNEIIERLHTSTFIGNKGSHDSTFVPTFPDAKAFWDDVCEFQALFVCNSCNAFVSTKYIDNVENKIRCKAGELTYSWKT